MTTKPRKDATRTSGTAAPRAADPRAVLDEGPHDRDGAGQRDLDRVRQLWEAGDWPGLFDLAELEAIETHPHRDRLMAMAAVGAAHSGAPEAARDCALRALEWGCGKDILVQILLGGASNLLGRAALLLDEGDLADSFFAGSISFVSPHSEVDPLARTRGLYERIRLGFLPEAAEQLGVAADDLSRPDVSLEDVRDLRQQVQSLRRQFDGSFSQVSTLPYPTLLSFVRSAPEAVPSEPIVLCTYHKAGTNFLLKTARAISERFGMPLWLKFYNPEPEDWRICLHQHGRVFDIARSGAFRGLRVIRHPMSTIYSAALYHESCAEPWVDVPLERFTGGVFGAMTTREGYDVIKDKDRSTAEKAAFLAAAETGDFVSDDDFAGRSYREMLQSFGTFEDKLRFEMNNYSRGVLGLMAGFPDDRRYFTLRLEDTARDRSMVALQQAVAHLGFAGAPAAGFLQDAAEQCLWNIDRPVHATTGMSDDWQDTFTGSLLEEFRGLFGDLEARLGYPQKN